VSRVLWPNDPAFHLVNALAHGLTAALLVSLLLALGDSPTAVTCAAAIFLAFPAHFEVVLWPAALPIALACSLFLVVCHLTLWRARRGARLEPWKSRGILLAIAALSFAIPCLYEQPAAGLAALPLLHWAAAPSGDRRRWRGGIMVALAACAGAAGYLALFWATVRPGTRGTTSALPGLDVLGSEAARVAREAAARLSLHEFGAGAITAGLAALLAAPAFTLGLATIAAGCAWLALRPGPEPAPGAPARRHLVVAFAFAVFLLCWLPLLAARGTPVSSRLTYAPSLGLAMVLAAARDGLTDRRGGRSPVARLIRVVVTGVVTAVAVLACVGMVGVQASYRARAQADTALGRTLRRAVPEPPPGTLFLVLADARRPVATGAAAFDGEFTSVLVLPQAATPWVRFAYARHDLFAAEPVAWGVTIAGVSDDGARIVGLEPAFPMQLDPDPRGGVVIPWRSMIPLRVDCDGRVHVEGPSAVRAAHS